MPHTAGRILDGGVVLDGGSDRLASRELTLQEDTLCMVSGEVNVQWTQVRGLLYA